MNRRKAHFPATWDLGVEARTCIAGHHQDVLGHCQQPGAALSIDEPSRCSTHTPPTCPGSKKRCSYHMVDSQRAAVSAAYCRVGRVKDSQQPMGGRRSRWWVGVESVGGRRIQLTRRNLNYKLCHGQMCHKNSLYQPALANALEMDSFRFDFRCGTQTCDRLRKRLN